jgi:hypothetical protein
VRRRWLFAVLAVALLAAIGLAAYLLLPHPPATRPCACPLRAGPLVLSVISESRAGARSWYNFTVWESGDFQLADTELQVQNSGGQPLATNASWALEALTGSGAPAGSYSFASSNWTVGADLPISECPDWSLSVGNYGNLSDQYDHLTLIGVGAISGTLSVQIP